MNSDAQLLGCFIKLNSGFPERVEAYSWCRLLASRNKISSFEIKLWLVPNSIFVFINHSLSPFGTDVFHWSM
jgi:hypothetical protein